MRFDNSKYSVIATTIGRLVEIRAYADRIELHQEGHLGREHCRCYSRDQTIHDRWNYVPVLARKRGLHHGAPFTDSVLPSAIDRVRRELAAVEGRDRQMVKILKAAPSDGLPSVKAACADAPRLGVHSAGVIINILARRAGCSDRDRGARCPAPCACRRLCTLRQLQQARAMIRSELLTDMGELKLYRMKGIPPACAALFDVRLLSSLRSR